MNKNKCQIYSVLDKSLDFLIRSQNKYGYFAGLSFTKDKSTILKNQSVAFHAYLISLSLSSIISSSKEARNSLINKENQKKISGIQTKIKQFILSQKDNDGTFNYWVKNSKQFKQFRYPNDLDDTAVALTSLLLIDKKAATGKFIANIASILTALETKVGGPYKTWLVSSKQKEWRDVDLGVNSNVGFLLSKLETSLPSLNKLVEQSIESNNFKSRYYHKPEALWYFVSRFYKGNKRKELIKQILKQQRKNGSWGSPLKTSLAMNALFNLKTIKKEELIQLEHSKNYLLDSAKNGVWPVEDLYFERKEKNKRLYGGSEALTTAFCLEAIVSCESYRQQLLNKKLKSSKSFKTRVSTQNVFANKVNSAIVAGFIKKVDGLPKKTSKILKNQSSRLLTSKARYLITLSPFVFAQAIKSKNDLDEKLLTDLGIANLCGWTAYDLLDDIIDRDKDKKLMFAVKDGMKLLDLCYREILKPADYKNIYLKIKKEMDEAIEREKNNGFGRVANKVLSIKKLPKYPNSIWLAKKSLGHSISILTLLSKNGFLQPKIDKTLKIFRHFLAARQLDDDAHDWQEDLEKGLINYVGLKVLKAGKAIQKVKSGWSIRLDAKSIQQMQKDFWFDIAPIVSEEIIHHIKQARTILKRLGLTIPEFDKELSKIENSAKTALKERSGMIEFLQEIKI